MSLSIFWPRPTILALRRLPYLVATDVDAAVIRFAEEAPVDPAHRVYTLRVRGYRVVLDVDHAERTVTVGWILAARD